MNSNPALVTALQRFLESLNRLRYGLPVESHPTGATRTRLVESAGQPTVSRTSQETIDELATKTKQAGAALLAAVANAAESEKPAPIDDHGVLDEIADGVSQWVDAPERDSPNHLPVKRGDIVKARAIGIIDSLQRIFENPGVDGAYADAQSKVNKLVALVRALASGASTGEDVAASVEFTERYQVQHIRSPLPSYDGRFAAAVSRASAVMPGNLGRPAQAGASWGPQSRLIESGSDYESRFERAIESARMKIEVLERRRETLREGSIRQSI
jgi:hypothetical protein